MILENREHCRFFRPQFIEKLNFKTTMKRIFELKSLGRISFAMAFCLASVLASAQDPATNEIKAAQQLIYKDKKKAAIEALQNAIKTYPEAAQLYYYLGRAQLLTGDKAGAKASFDKGVTLNGKEPLNYVGLGRILLLEKNAAQAKVQFDKAVSLGKKNVSSINAIAEAYLIDKAYQKDAMAQLQRSKEINEANPETYLLIGDANSLVMGQGGPAASAYERAYETDAKYSPVAEFKLGELFMSTNIQVAEEHYQKSVTADPGFAESQRELGELYYKKKDGVKAAKHYKAYLDLTDSPQPDDRFKYAFFLFMARDYDTANKEFEEQAKKPDVTSLVLKFYAQSLLKSGNLAKCQEIYERYLKHPDTKVDADDFVNYSDLLKKQGKDSLAMNALEKSISIEPNQPEILQTLIKYYFDKKKYPEAERVCRISIKTRKTPSTNDYFNLGRSLIAQKKYPQADSAFAKVIELKPEIVLGYLWAARSKGAQDGDLSDPKAKIEWLAKPYYEKVVEVGETDKDKNKGDLIQAYQYLAGHYLFSQNNIKAKEYLKKILELDPENADAKQAIKDIDAPPQQRAKPKAKTGK
jgi:tetratricopeptide (TPR) repeat protein